MLNFVLENKRDYQPRIITEMREIEDAQSCTVNFIFFHKSNFQNELIRLNRHNRFVTELMAQMADLGIKSSKSLQPGGNKDWPLYTHALTAPPAVPATLQDARIDEHRPSTPSPPVSQSEQQQGKGHPTSPAPATPRSEDTVQSLAQPSLPPPPPPQSNTAATPSIPADNPSATNGSRMRTYSRVSRSSRAGSTSMSAAAAAAVAASSAVADAGASASGSDFQDVYEVRRGEARNARLRSIRRSASQHRQQQHQQYLQRYQQQPQRVRADSIAVESEAVVEEGKGGERDGRGPAEGK